MEDPKDAGSVHPPQQRRDFEPGDWPDESRTITLAEEPRLFGSKHAEGVLFLAACLTSIADGIWPHVGFTVATGVLLFSVGATAFFERRRKKERQARQVREEFLRLYRANVLAQEEDKKSSLIYFLDRARSIRLAEERLLRERVEAESLRKVEDRIHRLYNQLGPPPGWNPNDR